MHFGKADAAPCELADAFHDVVVPIRHNEHIAAAALRGPAAGAADRPVVRAQH
ncbi:hypothetical protein ONA70_20585 [Micromonospora yasonensis]|uniref:hypothetical protein n=1 Tax=Micromonospora yasonensis TaxID=1128667 RepID=UPI002230DD1E|nr:hypothetical protein [Micromonospora yasonensis]MCW3842499.1 hypothetical protein [Micromonospora yasonensis]